MFQKSKYNGATAVLKPRRTQLTFLFCHLLWVYQLSGVKVTIVKADLGRDRPLQTALWRAPIKQWWPQLAALGHLMRFWGSIDSWCPLWIPHSQKLQENIGGGGGVGVAGRISMTIKMTENVTVTQGVSTQPWFQTWKGNGSRRTRNSASSSSAT